MFLKITFLQQLAIVRNAWSKIGTLCFGSYWNTIFLVQFFTMKDLSFVKNYILRNKIIIMNNNNVEIYLRHFQYSQKQPLEVFYKKLFL